MPRYNPWYPKIGEKCPPSPGTVSLRRGDTRAPTWSALDLVAPTCGKGLPMGKRLNPHRRLLAKQAALLNEHKQVQSVVQGADMAKLQQGRVRSPLAPRVQLTTYAAPRPAHWEGMGQRVRKITAKPTHSPVSENTPRERLKATALASDLDARKREKKWGVKLT